MSVAEAKANVKDHINVLISRIRATKDELDKVRDSWEFMLVKGRLLAELQHAMRDLTFSDCCPFCIENDMECDKCEYGKIHGKCQDEVSSWGLLREAIFILYPIIEMYSSSSKEEIRLYLKPIEADIQEFQEKIKKMREESK